MQRFSTTLLLVLFFLIQFSWAQTKSSSSTKSLNSNLLVNGDFSNGYTGFTSSYLSIEKTGRAMAGVYMITANPVDMNGAYYKMKDHTSGTGKMMVIDASTAGASDIIWQQNVAVKPKNTYTFSLYAASLYNAEPITVVVEINKVKVMTKTLPVGKHVGSWQHYFVNWTSENTSNAAISIYSTSTARFNADLALDDIRMSVKGTPPVDNTPMGIEYEEPADVEVPVETVYIPQQEEEEATIAVVDEVSYVVVEAPRTERAVKPSTAPTVKSLDAQPVTHSFKGKNLAINGDFSRGAEGFVSSYRTNCTAAPGVFMIVNKSLDMNGWYINVPDRTDGKGKLMIVDGSQMGATVMVWGQTLKVKKQKNYVFTVSVASLYDQNHPRLVIRINDTQAELKPVATGGSWQTYQAVWSSGASTTASISIASASTSYMGNDFALDDIGFYKKKGK